ncbi:Dyslexia susceptibility 1 candidate gene 1 protein-like protein [Camponotus floridanus]|uniref:Dyslexia susceptibility 1 candidate gene 1 protein-like protein n=2 Tax=Camponotus floridanus TaxID=104421 RepID=E2A8Y1_CAMFO|nr:Dyslexia susceptibility 1 candidate gene 1 protein-like protein [Camponotus floridanus]
MASDWSNLEVKDINEEQKRDFRKRALEKAQEVSDNRAKSKSEKRQYLQKEAVKVQVNVDTNQLNKIETLRDSHRRAAMQDFEDWRSSTELPIFQDISGKVQENRKAYRPPLKWFKDDLGVLRYREIDEKEKLRKKQDESMIIEELIVEEDPKETLSIEGNLKKELVVEEDTKKELIIEKKLEKELIVEENLKIESIDGANLKEKDTVLDENIQKEVNTLEKKETIPNKSSDPQDRFSSCSEDSESDYEMTSSKFATKSSIKKTGQKSSQKSCAQIRKQKSGQNLIDKVLKNRYSKINRIFDESAAVPLPRTSGTINITFSERAFPTPARESSLVEEEQWLSKQAEARRKTGFVVEDLRPEEQDPQWLKDKGDDFFKAGNYLAAISAYTHGIKISSEMTALYVNRSAAHYALGNYYRCIDDCSKVLELMEPKCESNRVSRARCHARRGAALCKLSAPQHGIPELEAALKLDPKNESIKHDLLATKQYFNIKE